MDLAYALGPVWATFQDHSPLQQSRSQSHCAGLAERPGLPYAVLYHVGRYPGRFYTTPLLVQPTKYGWVIPLTYGELTDWYRNIKQLVNALSSGREEAKCFQARLAG